MRAFQAFSVQGDFTALDIVDVAGMGRNGYAHGSVTTVGPRRVNSWKILSAERETGDV
ncbi:hypothetical protein [Streptomyces sp. NPDC059080]|uniref:hypothetical protein n=1 Tax=Streptomyces sp. NPDC059080 TaxID=3346718 RepID=UPI003690FEE8